MLDSIVTLLSKPEDERVEEEPEVPDFGRQDIVLLLFIYTMLGREKRTH